MISEDQVTYFKEHGFVIVPGLLSPSECDAMIARGTELDNAKQGNFRPQMMPHRTDATFLHALKNKAIADSISILCGGTPVGLQTQFFFCKPGTKGFSMHQDNFYTEPEDENAFVSAWCALVDVTEDMGSLNLYPGTHACGKLPVRKLSMGPQEGQDPNANDQETIVPVQFKPVKVSVPKGAVAFLHGNVVHSSNQNTSDKYRYVLLNTYIRKGVKFRPGLYAQRQEVELYDSAA